MSLPARFRGLPVSEGTAAGTLYVVDADAAVSASADEVAGAFAAVTAEGFALADRLRAAGRGQEAAIIEVGALIAADPALSEPALAAVRGGEDVALAVRAAAETQAVAMEALANRELAERAGDIRQVAQAVLERLGKPVSAARPDGDFILVRREVSPADLIDLAESGLAGAVSVAGGASSHAAIVARGLGIPMIAGADAAVLAVLPGQAGFLDADSGELIVGAVEGMAGATATSQHGPRARPTAPASTVSASTAPDSTVSASTVSASTAPARTADGREIILLCNVASAAETRRGLAAGAAGVGLLRTEIPFAQALAWPTLAEHRAALAPVLGLLAGKPATVRLLDFSGDKIPPFLRGDPPSSGQAGGLTALLTHPGALASQLRAVLETGRDTHLAVLIPMVRSLGEIAIVREALAGAAAALGCGPPRLGIMVELQSTAADAQAFAAAVDFFSIGTNDLTGDVLGLGRLDPTAGPALAAHPRVLTLIERVADAGRQAGIGVSVCGDSAADARVLPPLIGAGVGTLSVPAARVPRVRSWLARLDTAACAELVARASRATTAEQVWDLVPPL
jgi:phosphoenolpyruvate-protein kinase (PTS system EI component)